MIKRNFTNEITLGNIKIGGNFPIAIQSMTNTKTSDVSSTLRQINDLYSAGCDVIRVGVLNDEDLSALTRLVELSPIPLIADIHYSPSYVFDSIQSGCAGVRINPANILEFDHNLPKIIDAAKDNNTCIRLGVNAGSIKKTELYKKNKAKALADFSILYARKIEDLGFNNFKISIKHHDVLTTIESYKLVSKAGNWPLHIGVTEAGGFFQGTIKNTAVISHLLLSGIGDTIRVSLTDDPIKEVKVAMQILKSLSLMEKGIEIVSCPTCTRTNANIIELTKLIEDKLVNIKKNVTVAIMGCSVNGPGEASEADVGVAAMNNGRLTLFVKGEVVEIIDEQDVIEKLLQIIHNL